MPLPLVALAAAAAIPQVIKGVSGIFQSAKGRRMERNNLRPTYQIPGEFGTNVARAEMMAREGMPAAQYNQANNNIRTNMAGGFLAASRGRGRQNIASIVRAGNDATAGLGADSANMRLGNERYAMGQRQTMAQQRLFKQQWDKFDRYNEMDSKAQANIGAGRQNTMQAVDGISTIAMNAAGGGVFDGNGGGGGDAMGTMGDLYGNPALPSAGMAGVTQGVNPYVGQPVGMYGTRLNPRASQGRYGTRLNFNR